MRLDADRGRRATVALAVAWIAIDLVAITLMAIGVFASPGGEPLLLRIGLGGAALGFAAGTVLQFVVLRGAAGRRLSLWRRIVKYAYLATRVAVVLFLLLIAVR